MKRVILTQGKTALISDRDYVRVRPYKWRAHRNNRGQRTWYAATHIRGCYVLMHRFILGLVNQPKRQVDHKNRDGLDNQRRNLRYASASQNSMNRARSRRNTSGIKGVIWNKEHGKWQAHIRVSGYRIHLGYFRLKSLAARAYALAATYWFGQFARTQ